MSKSPAGFGCRYFPAMDISGKDFISYERKMGP
jgi:hypothetical protein